MQLKHLLLSKRRVRKMLLRMFPKARINTFVLCRRYL